MLRRKLIIHLGSLVALLLISAFTAIFVLNNVLTDLNETNDAALARSEQTGAINAQLTSIETELTALQHGEHSRLDVLVDAVEEFDAQVDRLVERNGREFTELAGELDALRSELRRRVNALARSHELPAMARHIPPALEMTAAMRAATAEISRLARDRTDQQWQTVTGTFRWTVFWLGLVFLVVINLSILVLLRAASIIVPPIEKLVEASRRLAEEDFDHRILIDRRDEFGELARASNSLAEQLKRNEERKIETLQQVARMLSHELNNAISIIDLQLQMVARAAGGDDAQAERLKQIHQTLMRMSGTVDALNRVRRIVLTDYIDGIKMLDLPRSVEEPQSPGNPTEPATSSSS
ncbi:MAG: HAMP domain-containing protein [Planctomycetes bacterium]|nr:HAMP domain-containing protein [Planctomycetota bacterium]